MRAVCVADQRGADQRILSKRGVSPKEEKMRKLVFAMALGALMLLAYQNANAQSSPCCAPRASDGKACNQDAVGIPDGNGCQELDAMNCIGGSASASGAQGCVCVAGMCASGPIPPSGPGVIGLENGMGTGMYTMCTNNAVAGCEAAGQVH
jgi:hypothetical protein